MAGSNSNTHSRNNDCNDAKKRLKMDKKRLYKILEKLMNKKE